MPLTNFVAGVTTVTATWLNKLDAMYVTLFGEATTAAQARTALGVSATGADTSYCLKSNNLSDVTAATARTNLGAAASGAATSSGLTMATSRLIGRTTASTGALEEISVGTGLTLSAGTLSNSAVPSGVLFDFAGTAVPTGFLGCDGSAVSRTTYAALFTAIGTTWGAGDGSTTFNLPDFRRRVAVGSGGSGTGTLGNAVGNTGGAETHTLVIGEIPAHTHANNWGSAGPGVDAGVMRASNTAYGAVDTNSAGSGGAHNNMQPSAVVLKIIKT